MPAVVHNLLPTGDSRTRTHRSRKKLSREVNWRAGRSGPSGGCHARSSWSDDARNRIGPGDVRVDGGAGLRIVEVVPEDPLEVVQQRPVAVSEHRDAVGDGVEQAAQRGRQEAMVLRN
jgi:hypothetical protein